MAKNTLTKRDLNRFRKIYPYIRRRIASKYVIEEEMIVETGTLIFDNENEKAHAFTSTFPTTPSISAVAVDTDGSANVNIFVSSISTTSVTFKSSNNFKGSVSFQAIYVGS